MPMIPHDGEQHTLFSMHDPFGVRKAIAHVFSANANEDLQGLGTAFAIDPGGFVATDHHGEYARAGSRWCSDASKQGLDRGVVVPKFCCLRQFSAVTCG